jgi:hypothetical protein
MTLPLAEIDKYAIGSAKTKRGRLGEDPKLIHEPVTNSSRKPGARPGKPFKQEFGQE